MRRTMVDERLFVSLELFILSKSLYGIVIGVLEKISISRFESRLHPVTKNAIAEKNIFNLYYTFHVFLKNMFQINWLRLIPKIWEDFSFWSLTA